MSEVYPRDADGDALRRVASHSNMAKPMSVDFQVSLPTAAAAAAFEQHVRQVGYQTKIYGGDEADGRWTCECSTRMLASYDGVIAIQRELAEMSDAFAGYPDGWGTFGNEFDEEPKVD